MNSLFVTTPKHKEIEVSFCSDDKGNVFVYVGVRYFGSGKDLEPLLKQVASIYDEEDTSGRTDSESIRSGS